MFIVKRIYEKPSKKDGSRILVERLWPRGLTKDKAALDLWLKEVAPSTELRKWFGHDPAKWSEFRRRYTKELHQKSDLLKQLKLFEKKGVVTLLYGAKDEKHNSALVLKSYLD